VDIYARWLDAGVFPDRLMDSVTSDRAVVMEMVYGTIKRKRMLEWVARRLVKHRADPRAMPYLMIGLYQLLVMDHVADHATVNETVEAAKNDAGFRAKGRRRDAANFINAVLREALRRRELLESELKEQTIGIRESHPDILVERWTRVFDAQRTLDLCRWNNGRPDVVLRLNRHRTDADTFLGQLRSAGIEAVPHSLQPATHLVMPRGVHVDGLPGYAEGLFSVQDPSTAVAVDLLDPQPGEAVLDACAAPGGKTFMIAERMLGQGRLVAMDSRQNRVALLTENLARMGYDAVEAVHADASCSADMEKAGGPFDRILLDVPCTNTGVLRRRPDARWRFSKENLASLRTVQRGLLKSAARHLRTGGTIVYSTCSLEPEECSKLVASWLRHRPEFTLQESASLFPPESLTDGVYAAVLQKK
jgi:16S rRNA (cytosine967-C5)-methyltransferase